MMSNMTDAAIEEAAALIRARRGIENLVDQLGANTADKYFLIASSDDGSTCFDTGERNKIPWPVVARGLRSMAQEITKRLEVLRTLQQQLADA